MKIKNGTQEWHSKMVIPFFKKKYIHFFLNTRNPILKKNGNREWDLGMGLTDIALGSRFPGVPRLPHLPHDSVIPRLAEAIALALSGHTTNILRRTKIKILLYFLALEKHYISGYTLFIHFFFSNVYKIFFSGHAKNIQGRTKINKMKASSLTFELQQYIGIKTALN